MERPAARNLEAAGAAGVTFDFRGTTVTIPLRLEDWPLDDIRAGRKGRAIKALLGAQRPPMRTQDDAAELSHRMADACGVTPLPDADADAALMFGAVPLLLHAVDNHGDDLEADLRRFYGIDYRDPAACTLRQVWVMIRRMPPESAIMVARNGGELPWSRGEIIAARSWEMWTRKRYPGRPPTKAELDEWKAKHAGDSATMSTLAEREEYYRSGQNMRDAGVDPGPPPPPKQPPRSRALDPDNPVDAALAVAMKNARRTPTRRSTNEHANADRSGTRGSDADAGPGFRNGDWDNGSSTWG